MGNLFSRTPTAPCERPESKNIDPPIHHYKSYPSVPDYNPHGRQTIHNPVYPTSPEPRTSLYSNRSTSFVSLPTTITTSTVSISSYTTASLTYKPSISSSAKVHEHEVSILSSSLAKSSLYSSSSSLSLSSTSYSKPAKSSSSPSSSSLHSAISMVIPQLTAGEEVIALRPIHILFTQDSIAPHFQGSHFPLEALINVIHKDLTEIHKIPAIKVMIIEGAFWSLDNRRLYVLRKCAANRRVQCILVPNTKKNLEAYRVKKTSMNGDEPRIRRNRARMVPSHG